MLPRALDVASDRAAVIAFVSDDGDPNGGPFIGEQPIDGVDSEALAEGLRAHGHRMVRTVSDPAELAQALRDLAAPGDLIICMGAGDITKWAASLADGIRKARASK